MKSDLTTILQGESVVLMPERAMLIERTRTLLAADVHLGKDTAFRIAGIPIPGDATADSLARLSSALERSQANRLIFLGDLVHARTSLDAMTVATIQAWRERHSEIEMLLVPGNHDARSGALPLELQIETTADELIEPPFVFKHHPEASPHGYALAGHIHPAIRLIGRGKQRERVACFLFRPDYGLLPAFGTFTGGYDIRPQPEDRIFAVAPGQIIKTSSGR
jgi:DNA ligase-associated metallophosphoesterase